MYSVCAYACVLFDLTFLLQINFHYFACEGDNKTNLKGLAESHLNIHTNACLTHFNVFSMDKLWVCYQLHKSYNCDYIIII